MRGFRYLTILAVSGALLSAPASPSGARPPSPGGASASLFSVPPRLKVNVDFWRDVFVRYTTSQVVLHDEEDLGRVYGTLPLGAPWTATRTQRRTLKDFEMSVRRFLLALADGRPLPSLPPGGEEMARRIRKMFKGRPPEEARSAAFLVRTQPGLRELIRGSYVRAGRHLPRFRRIFQKHGLPLELTLLPHVESSFRAMVYSRAGALGMWQFTRGTGRLFMRVDAVVDGRRDPYLSADAAARLLKRLHAALGSWPLALTAYNHGLGGVRRAVESVGSRDISEIVAKYRGRSFGFASRNFYAEFLAALQVHRNAKKHFGDLRPSQPDRFDSFHLPRYLSLAEISRRLGVPEGDLRALNPALRTPVIRGRRRVPRGYPMRLPEGAGERARRIFAPGLLPADAGAGAKWVMIRPGDTLSHIARRHRTSVAFLMEENELVSTRIHPGVRLRIPGGASIAKAFPAKEAPAAPAAPAKGGPGSASKPSPEKPKAPPARPSSPGRPAPLARSAPPPGGDGSSAPKSPSPREKALRGALAVRPTRDGSIGTVRVRENETLGRLALGLGVTPAALRRLNGLPPAGRIGVGEGLRVPLGGAPKAAFLERRLAFHRGVERDFFRKFKVIRTLRHKLRPGENVWTLTRRTFKAPFWLLQSYNPRKDLRRVAAGDALVVPVLEKRGK